MRRSPSSELLLVHWGDDDDEPFLQPFLSDETIAVMRDLLRNRQKSGDRSGRQPH